METAQERELLQLQLLGWPFHAVQASLDASTGYTYSGSSISSGGGDSFFLGWEPPFGCFGVVASDAHLHDLFPLCLESLPMSPALSMAAAAALPTEPQGAVTMPGELDELLNFWDGDASEKQPAAINSSCVPQLHLHEKGNNSSSAAIATASSFLLYGDDDPLSSIFSKGPVFTPEEEAVFQAPAPAAEPLASSSSSSSCHAGPRASDAQQPQDAAAPSGPRAPRCSTSASSLKRATPEESTEAECSQSSSVVKRQKKAAPGRVVCPFAVLKPDGLDGGATLADINARILMRPARPVRHPVGEYACAPRVLARDAPGISGKAVAGFTRLHTPGRGTITIMRTRG
ncbi:uncharacterized protein LOC100823808 [Brachypodium distachyon]|uniref:Protein XRI1 n=1 Tax=Brachypodium distachyon TaxID=15368 RepID=I1IQL3_BRADI|nr:uncharacterized protein LOC100823808 [Brachypodium distachyon]KQJ90464.1 hypothetical protein BRADI_4g31740v3 [Brachypodium distachyon]|eukprot:XP_010238227.1 uncharacterized protein LOC100823808 [Brachypodium distachyon]